MSTDWIGLIALFTFVQLLFLAVVIVNHKKGKRLSNLLLAGFMFSNALLILNTLLSRGGWISPTKSPVISSIGGSMYFLLMPFLFLYIESLCYDGFRFKTIRLFHAAPFIVFVLYALVVRLFGFAPLRVSPETILGLNLLQPGVSVSAIERSVHQIALHLLIFSYLVASSIVLIRYRRRLMEMYSSIEKIDLQWCNLLLIFFAAMWMLDLSNWLLRYIHLSTPGSSRMMLMTSLFINLAFTLFVTYKGLTQSATFSGIQEPAKYASSRLAPSDLDDIVESLNTLMENDKPYLSPTLSINDLSNRLKVSVKSLSQTIHICFNRSFYDFVNSYRIEEIKKRLRDEQYGNLTITAIAFDAGFNSKSVFNAAFKKYTGLTPSEYKKVG